jgi:general secretion pathway protein B
LPATAEVQAPRPLPPASTPADPVAAPEPPTPAVKAAADRNREPAAITLSRHPAPPRPVFRDPKAAARGSKRPEVKVQAIAWSADPASRIAVIDGHVLHEGDGLGQVRVSRIDKDQVILTRNGESWSVAFGR